MNSKRTIIFVGATIIFFLLLTIWLAKRTAKAPLNIAETYNETNTSRNKMAVGSSHADTNPPSNTNNFTGAFQNAAKASLTSKENQIKEGLAALNDSPIAFYGKLEDQFGKPVIEALINGDIRIFNGVQSTVEHLTTESDSNGLFHLSGKHGESLSIVPRKEGYALASSNGGGIYSTMWPDENRVHPDPNNPIIVKMWRLQGAEPLIKIDHQYKIPVEGFPVSLDLLGGQIVSGGGDIKLTINRSPGIISERNQLNWSVQVEAINGGLIETSMAEARVTYQAPENNYKAKYVFVMSTNAPNKWFGGFQQMFFVSSRDGQVYSKALLSFRINTNPDESLSLTVKGVANTNGSRNWEADPNVMTPR